MKIEKMLTSRLGGENFFETDYYKFEKFARLKKEVAKDSSEAILDFGIGENYNLPDFSIIKELNEKCWYAENNLYTDNGFDLFKHACSNYLKNMFDLEVADYKTMINQTIGAKSALCIIPMSFIDEGDVIITTTPGYQVLANFGKWLKADIYNVNLLPENKFLPDLDSIPIEVYEKTKIFSINYPNNPTGATATIEFYEKLISYAKKYHFIIVNDCVYGPLTYCGKPLSILSVPGALDCCYEIHSLSKGFNMTGMRIGFVVANEKLIHIFKEVKDNMDSGQYKPIMYAAIKAMSTYETTLPTLKSFYFNRLNLIVNVLKKNNLKCYIPDATFYLYVEVPESFKSAEEFAIALLKEAKVFTIPWDEAGKYVRLSMTFNSQNNDKEYATELNRRLKKFLK